MLLRATAVLALMLASVARAQAPPVPNRTPLAVIPVEPAKEVSRVVTNRVDFAPGQVMPMHKHTVPVICFVSKGNFLTKIGDEDERVAAFGTVTYEPPGVVVSYFKNASASAPAQLQCAALAGYHDTVLNIMLDQPEGR